jgi:hypothetical protein
MLRSKKDDYYDVGTQDRIAFAIFGSSNRSSTESKALFFKGSDKLMRLVETMAAQTAA